MPTGYAAQNRFSEDGYNIGMIWANSGSEDGRSGYYNVSNQVTRLAVAASPADGTMILTITGPNGTFTTEAFTASSSTQAQVVAGLAGLVNNDIEINPTASASGSGANVDIKFRRASQAYTVTVSGTAASNITVSTPTTSVKDRLPTGIAVQRNTTTGSLEPATSTDNARVLGVSGYFANAVESQDPNDADSVEGYEAGATVPVKTRAPIVVRLADGANPSVGDQLHRVTTGAQAGYFTNVSTNNTAIAGTFESTASLRNGRSSAKAYFRMP